MNKSIIFKKAHKIAKAIVAKVGNYMIAMSIALKEVYASMKNKGASMREKLEALGLSVWGEDFGKARIYINTDDMMAVFGLSIGRYKTGAISCATLNGEKISNSRAYKILENKIYFDVEKNEFVGTDLEPIL